MLELVLGGVRSGKSLYAEELAAQSSEVVCYIATAENWGEEHDPPMAQRINRHRARRPGDWLLIEEPLYLSRAIAETTTPVILIDCMGLWITNLLLQEQQDLLSRQINAFLDVISATEQHIIIVSSEVGLGIVPLDPLSRDFVDQCGELNQRIAALADRVWFSVAGIPQLIKDASNG